MKILTFLCISLVILFEVHAKKLDSGTKAVNGSTSASASASAPASASASESASASASASASSTSKTSQVPSQSKNKRYATREVILYLTPSQIKALEAGEGLVNLPPLSEPVDQEQQTNQDLKLQEQTEFVKQEFENLKSASIQEVEKPESDEEHLEFASQEPILPKEQLFTINQQELDDQWIQELANREEQLKLYNYYHELKKAEQLKLQQEVNGERIAWFPYSPKVAISEGYGVPEVTQLNSLAPLPSYDQNSENLLSQSANPLLQLQYSPRYNDQRKAIEIENILRTRHRHELKQQNALIQAEKIANAPAILVHDHVKITKQPAVPVVKNVKVPVPTPIWVSVPEPVPVRVSHPYPVLQSIIKHIPVPIQQKEGLEREKAVPYNVENRISAPFSKVLFFNVDTPYVDQKIVPVEIKSWSQNNNN